MNRHLTTSKESKNIKTVTLKDTNIEATKILTKELMRTNVRKGRRESDIYLSGPYFPCEDFNKFEEILRRNTTKSFNKNVRSVGWISKTEAIHTVEKENRLNENKPVKRCLVKQFESNDERSSLNKTMSVPIPTNNDATLDQISKVKKREKTPMCVARTTPEPEETTKDKLENITILAGEREYIRHDDSTHSSGEFDRNLSQLGKIKKNNKVRNEAFVNKKNEQFVRLTSTSKGSSSELNLILSDEKQFLTVTKEKVETRNNGGVTFLEGRNNFWFMSSHNPLRCNSELSPMLLEKKQPFEIASEDEKRNTGGTSSEEKSEVLRYASSNDSKWSKSAIETDLSEDKQKKRNNEHVKFVEERRNESSLIASNFKRTGGQIDAKLSNENKSVTIKTTEETEDEVKNVALLEDKRIDIPKSSNNSRDSSRGLDLKLSKENQSGTIKTEKQFFSSAENSRQPTSQLQVKSRSTGSRSPLARRRESNNSFKDIKTSPTQNSSMLTHDEFGLENILNPTLRESLKKILNPECDQSSDAMSECTEDNGVHAGRGYKNIFKDDVFLPNLKKRTAKYKTLDFDTTSVIHDREANNKKSTRHVRFMVNRPLSQLSSVKCAEIVESRGHSKHMLSTYSEYAVKGVIGQWLKQRRITQGGSDIAAVEKQETYREVQLLKVGLSMRMLAGLV